MSRVCTQVNFRATAWLSHPSNQPLRGITEFFPHLLWLVCLIADFTLGFSFVLPESYESSGVSHRLTGCVIGQEDDLRIYCRLSGSSFPSGGNI